MDTVLAAVRVAPGKTEIREFPAPEISADSALLKMEVAGICGTDVKMYQEPPFTAPVIMGHENIGTIAKAGREFTKRKGFKEGDLVFLEHYFADFARKHDEAKLVEILRKTWRKMSPRGQQAALGLQLSAPLRAIVEKAVTGSERP